MRCASSWFTGCVLALLLLLPWSLLSASELTVVSVISADGQDVGPGNGSLVRLIGTTVSVQVQFSEAVTTQPDANKIHVYLAGTTTVAGTNLGITNLNSALNTTWKLTFTTIIDGDVDIVFDDGAATSTLSNPLKGNTAGSIQFTLDRIPTFQGSYTKSSTTIRVVASSLLGATEGLGGSASVDDTKITVSNGYIYDAGNIDSKTLYYDVQPYGYGTIVFQFGKGFVDDKWGNLSAALTVNALFSAPADNTRTPPRILALNGLSPADKVYRTGDVITLDVQFDRAVHLAGTDKPYLRLNCTGTGSTAKATYVKGSDTAFLTFSYTVLDGHKAALLDIANATAFVIPDSCGVAGIASTPDHLANVTLPVASLPETAPYAINVEPSKPYPEDIPGTGDASAKGCGAGSAAAVLLAGLGLSVAFRRRSGRQVA
jgi:hypothetical protein